MKEFIDKLISRLEELKELHAELIKDGLEEDYHSGCEGMCVDIIEIINELAEEYKGKKVNSDLISRSETIKELNEIYLDNPWDDKEDILEKAIGIVEHINCSTKVSEMPTGWIPCSSGYFSTSEVLVCKEDGTIDFDVYDFMDNDWKFNSNHHKNKVIAWQPLPAPLKEGE